MSKPSTSEDIENLQKSQDAANAAKAMMDQNAKYGPQGPAAGNATAAGGGGQNQDESTLGMLRRKYGINPNIQTGPFG